MIPTSILFFAGVAVSGFSERHLGECHGPGRLRNIILRACLHGTAPKTVGPDTIWASVARLRLGPRSVGPLAVLRGKGVGDPRHLGDGVKQGQRNGEHQSEFENRHGQEGLSDALWPAIRIVGKRGDSRPKGSGAFLFDR